MYMTAPKQKQRQKSRRKQGKKDQDTGQVQVFGVWSWDVCAELRKMSLWHPLVVVASTIISEGTPEPDRDRVRHSQCP